MILGGAGDDDRFVTPEAAGDDLGRVHPQGFDEVVFHRLGTFDREVEVEFVAADEVGVALDPAVKTGVAVHQQAEFHQADLGALAEFRAVKFEKQVAGQHGFFAEQDIRGQIEQAVERDDAVESAVFDLAVGTSFDEILGELPDLIVVHHDRAGVHGHLADFRRLDVFRLAAEVREIGVHFQAGGNFKRGRLGISRHGGVFHLQRILGLDDRRLDVDFLILG